MVDTFWYFSGEEETLKDLYFDFQDCFHRPVHHSEIKMMDPFIQDLYAKMTACYPDESGISFFRHPRYSFPVLQKYDRVELVFCYCGTCTGFIGDSILTMTTGDFMIVAPETPRAFSVTDDETVVFHISIDNELFDEGFIRLFHCIPLLGQFFEDILSGQALSSYILFPTGTDRWMHESIRQIWVEAGKGGFLYDAYLALYVRQLFIHIVRHYKMHAIVSDPDQTSPNEWFTMLIGYITVNVRDITLEKTAEFFGYNKNYLGQLIQKYTGMTFNAYVNEIAMRNAARLLEESDKSITEIAQEVGCFDSSHFNRRFKKIYHITPKEYRKKHDKAGIYLAINAHLD